MRDRPRILLQLTGHGSAFDERVSGIAGKTTAHRNVIDNIATRVRTARAGAWIDALVAQTCFVSVTFHASHAFRPTTVIRITLIFGKASAYAISAFSVGSARRWIARIVFHRFDS
jgi:hypothetical protein